MGRAAAASSLTAEVLLITRARCRSTWWQVIAIVGLVVVGTASAYGGHGAAGRWHYMGVFLTMLHVSAMAVWLGGLTMLVISFSSVDRRSATRFSSIAILAVATVVVTGSIQAVRQVGSVDALTGTSYGKLLIWKVHRRSRPRSRSGRQAIDARPLDVVASGRLSVGAAAADDGFDRARLRRAVSIETMLAVVIVIVTSLLMAANPSQATASAPFSTTHQQRLPGHDHGFHRPGSARTKSTSSCRAPAAASTSPARSPSRSKIHHVGSTRSRSTSPKRAPAIHQQRGHFPYAATWRLVVTARYGFDEVTFTADVRIV